MFDKKIKSSQQNFKDLVDKMKTQSLTKESYDEFLKLEKTKNKEFIRANEKEEKREKTKTGTCKVCDGKVIQVHSSRSNTDWRRAIVGPGSKNDTINKVSYHCESCGLCYQFLPGEIVYCDEVDEPNNPKETK